MKTTITGKAAKELRKLGVWGTYRADGVMFTLTETNRGTIELEIEESDIKV